MPHDNREIARHFLDALSSGDLPEDLLTADMRAWSVTSGQWSDKAKYRGAIRLLASAFDGGLRYDVQSLTAEGERVAAEVRAEGTLINGEPYENDYLFLLFLRDGRIASVREYFRAAPVREKLVPLMSAIVASKGGERS